MKRNIGTGDIAIRMMLAIIIVTLFALDIISGISGVILLVLSGIFVITSAIRFCPLYVPFGMSTRKFKVEEN